jgi:hypothetical protein
MQFPGRAVKTKFGLLHGWLWVTQNNFAIVLNDMLLGHGDTCCLMCIASNHCVLALWVEERMEDMTQLTQENKFFISSLQLSHLSWITIFSPNAPTSCTWTPKLRFAYREQQSPWPNAHKIFSRTCAQKTFLSIVWEAELNIHYHKTSSHIKPNQGLFTGMIISKAKLHGCGAAVLNSKETCLLNSFNHQLFLWLVIKSSLHVARTSCSKDDQGFFSKWFATYHTGLKTSQHATPVRRTALPHQIPNTTLSNRVG